MHPEADPTCGTGVASQAGLPAKFAELISATADVLERHATALDQADPAARQELAAYSALVHAHRAVAGDLERLAQQMRDCRDLPVARHDEAAMAGSAGQAEAYERFVALQGELFALLANNLEEHHRAFENR
jgi:hypothetical protein